MAVITQEEANQVRAQLERVLASRPFVSSARRVRLLRFLVEETLAGRGDSLKESVLAVEVFDRRADHDPSSDSLVRVEMGRLRSRLIEYYAQLGADDPVRIELPRGSYTPGFTFAGQPEGRETLPFQNGLVSVNQRPARANWTKIAWLSAAALVALAAVMAIRSFSSRTGYQSAAVLPFLNLTGIPGDEYLSDSITDELTGALAEAKNLRVVARTSSFQYKGKSADIRQVGRALGADAVLEGSLARHGEQLRIVVQLIRAADGYHLWSQTYDFQPGELQRVEEQIARQSAQVLLPGKPVALRSPLLVSTPNPEAYDLFLRARYAFRRGTLESARTSLELARQAAQKDPTYALPYWLMGSADYTLSQLTAESEKVSLERELPNIERAIRLDPALGDAHTSHAFGVYDHDWDWPRAEAEFKLALELGSTTAPSLYGWSLATRGQFREALVQLGRAEQLDPLAAGPRINSAVVLGFQGRFPDARPELRRVVELNPQSTSSYLLLEQIDLAEKNCPAAETQLGKLKRISAAAPATRFADAWWNATCGQPAEARRILADLEASPSCNFAQLALVYNSLGDLNRAIRSFEKAADNRESQVLYMALDFPGLSLQPLRKDARFSALLRRIGLSN